MRTLVLTNVDEDLLARLLELAAANHLSVEEQAAQLLKEGSRREERGGRVAVLKAIAAMTPKGVHQTDSVALLREDRNR